MTYMIPGVQKLFKKRVGQVKDIRKKITSSGDKGGSLKDVKKTVGDKMTSNNKVLDTIPLASAVKTRKNILRKIT